MPGRTGHPECQRGRVTRAPIPPVFVVRNIPVAQAKFQVVWPMNFSDNTLHGERAWVGRRSPTRVFHEILQKIH